MTQPAGEAPFGALLSGGLAQQPGGDVGGDEGGLDGQRARPAQRVDDAAARSGDRGPPGAQENGRSQRLFEWRLGLLAGRPVAAAVQALSGEVDGDDGFARADVDVDAQVGPRQIDRGPPAKTLAELVDHDVLGALRAEQRVGHPDARAKAGEVDRQRAVGREVRRPVDRGQARPERLGVAVEAQRHQAQQHSLRQPRPEARAVAQRERSVERDAAALLGHARRVGGRRGRGACGAWRRLGVVGERGRVGGDGLQLLAEERLGALGGGREELQVSVSGVTRHGPHASTSAPYGASPARTQPRPPGSDRPPRCADSAPPQAAGRSTGIERRRHRHGRSCGAAVLRCGLAAPPGAGSPTPSECKGRMR